MSKELAPYGKLWRTGANEATQIQFLTDMKFGEKTIKTKSMVYLSTYGFVKTLSI